MSEKASKRVILDVDAGIDDAFAIVSLLYAAKINAAKIEAITLTHGNCPLSAVAKNVVRILELTDQTHVPVYAGACEPLILPDPPIISDHFGMDGFCDVPHDKEPNLSLVQEKVAAVAINDIVMQSPGEITLMCIGPLTNIALAVKLFSTFASNVKEIFIFGGNYQAIGNTPMTAEYNFFMDPEAAHVVLKSAKCPMTIMPYEAVLDCSIDDNWRFKELGVIKSPIMKLLNEAEIVLHSTEHVRPGVWTTYDPYLVAAALFPNEIVTESEEFHVSIELFGALTRGQMVLDHKHTKPPNALLIKKVNIEAFKKLTFEIMSNV